MKMRQIAALLFLTVGVAGIMDASSKGKGKKKPTPSSTSRGPVTCDKIPHGTKEESFVARISCARQAIMAKGNSAKAYELMAPVYKHAKTSKSNTARDSRDKLGAIVSARLGDSNAKDLFKNYKVEDVYVAVALADGRDPMSGKETDEKASKRYAVDPELTSAVSTIIDVAPTATIEEEEEESTMPLPSAPVGLVAQIAGPGSDEGIAEWQNIIAQEELKIFTLNALLTTMFEYLLDKQDFQLAQALTDVVKRGNNEDIALLKEIVKNMQKDWGINQAYEYLQQQKNSWFGRVGVAINPRSESSDYVEQWVAASPDSKLVDVLQGDDQLKTDTLEMAQKYLKGAEQVKFDHMFRRAEALRLARTAISLLNNPQKKDNEDRTFLTETYDNLIKSLDVGQDKKMKEPLERGNLNSMSALLGEIQGKMLVDSIPTKQMTPKDKVALKKSFSTAAKIGGVVAVTALVALIATQTQVGKKTMSQIQKSVADLYGYLPEVPESVKAYIPSLGGIGASAGAALEKVSGLIPAMPAMPAMSAIPGGATIARATSAVVGGLQSIVTGAISSAIVGWIGSKVSESFAAAVGFGKGMKAMGQQAEQGQAAQALGEGLAAFGGQEQEEYPV